jgi:O-acetyl-ADP-ribose deacetylase (regulator of RNase III)
MIHEVTGDILLSKAHWIAHGVGVDDDFKSGLALSLRERFPSLYKDFRHYCKTYRPKPGTLWAWSGVAGADQPTMHVLSLLTQDPPMHKGGHPGRAQLTHVNHALHALAKYLASHEIRSLALPRLATGVGGLAWDDVRPLIQSTLGGAGLPVFVYTTFKAGEQAHEPGA